jgi:murein L,D-transpeptidase YafK
MKDKGTTQNAPVLIRTYKKEAEFEVWKMAADGRYVLLKTYPMCRWSGQLGPKTREGDRQVPEGFYTITPGQMNPNSASTSATRMPMTAHTAMAAARSWCTAPVLQPAASR